jgi:hypothetical protein
MNKPATAMHGNWPQRENLPTFRCFDEIKMTQLTSNAALPEIVRSQMDAENGWQGS